VTNNPLLTNSGLTGMRLDRNTLKEQSTRLLRNQIIGGHIPQGTKLTERDLAELLGISRMPARDALMALENEGLVESKANGRYVIEVSEIDIQHLFQVRLVLERLAVGEAATHTSPANCTALRHNLQKMQTAITQSNREAYVQSDLEAHQLIWQQAENPYLLSMLNSITGPIFLFIASHTEFQRNWQETLQLHQELADAICTGDVAAAVASIETQLNNSLDLSQQVFEKLRNQH
jgi:DNA-binding GntR family transcriptional regulator